jgi:hypothetical protein
MGAFLLYNPWIQSYLLYVAALVIICLWDGLRHHPATQGGSKKPPQSVLNPGRQAE